MIRKEEVLRRSGVLARINALEEQIDRALSDCKALPFEFLVKDQPVAVIDGLVERYVAGGWSASVCVKTTDGEYYLTLK